MSFFIYLAQVLPSTRIETAGLPIVSIGELLTFIIRMIFVIAGVLALIYGLWGGFDWIVSGGEKDKIQAARDKIQAAIVGVFVLVIVLSIIWTLENIVFQRSICFGISCPISIPSLGTNPLPRSSSQTNVVTTPSGSTNVVATSTPPPSSEDQLPNTGGR